MRPKIPRVSPYKEKSMTIGVAVIGAGMAGRAHAAAYRTAPTLYESILPDLRFVSIGDVSPELGSLAARRFGYERNDTSWQAIAEDPDINVVSVVVANTLHREIVLQSGLQVRASTGPPPARMS